MPKKISKDIEEKIINLQKTGIYLSEEMSKMCGVCVAIIYRYSKYNPRGSNKVYKVKTRERIIKCIKEGKLSDDEIADKYQLPTIVIKNIREKIGKPPSYLVLYKMLKQTPEGTLRSAAKQRGIPIDETQIAKAKKMLEKGPDLYDDGDLIKMLANHSVNEIMLKADKYDLPIDRERLEDLQDRIGER